MNGSLEKRLVALEKAHAEREQARLIERVVAQQLERFLRLQPPENEFERQQAEYRIRSMAETHARAGRLREPTQQEAKMVDDFIRELVNSGVKVRL